MKLAKRAASLTPSTTLAITAKAKELKAAGHDVIGLGAGEPDYNTPEAIIKAAEASMEKGYTKYTPSGGLKELKDAIIDKFKEDQGLSYTPAEVIVCTGAKHALYTLFQVILDEGDEVIVPSPYWVSYPEQVKLAGGKPVIIEGSEEKQFKITPEQIAHAANDRTKALILNSPSNPTGMIYTEEELIAIGETCIKHDLLIVSDEIYEKLVYGEAKHFSIAQLSAELKERTVVINGVSKSHSMTGWRIGYAAGPKEIISAMTNLASHSTSNPASMAQYGAIEAYRGSQEPVEDMRKSFENRLDQTHALLEKIPGFRCIKPQGAFYLFANASEAARATGHESVDAFVEALLSEEKVALVPGSGFGSPDHVRLSYATSQDQLTEALARISRYMENHQA
ncbi:aminotransferase class I/II-fold pyridoxal phosphate-dependent enzyme [Bacillus mangrovi]|uniref:Aminotransferase n=1 Tax=Metabacillus mangrovi TaxID=1491830 RepID=A0A7X2S2N2_9BACI|nr:pyridoxal phosphate-dependent aminotransferase [Metabacillus mangrovi]MTH52135.1 aminotransferase class I/II-fold pyridoxal phosphate-dependent enzyme [Metabacillus mangrovi]